jgi:hypothetical protein
MKYDNCGLPVQADPGIHPGKTHNLDPLDGWGTTARRKSYQSKHLRAGAKTMKPAALVLAGGGVERNSGKTP